MAMINEMEERSEFPPTGAPGWMFPLVSMMTMLLAICILLLSISRPDSARLADATASIRAAFGLEGLSSAGASPASREVRSVQEAIEFDQAVQLVRIKEKLEAMHSRLPDSKGLEVKGVDEGFLVRLSRGSIFVEGSVTIRPEVEPLLKQMAELYARLPNLIRIDCHGGEGNSASGVPMKSVWALTAAEAATLADFLVVTGGLDPARLVPRGHPAVRGERSGAADRPRTPHIDILLSREVRSAASTPPSVPVGASLPSTAAGGAQ
ncbi:MAG: hypothetical protein HQM00_00735 [Magnetococcales bacterium]|nr:hypothetical protein [Magnetococcales bacterium]